MYLLNNPFPTPLSPRIKIVARKTGKVGLIQLADKGTLFLDEIGEELFLKFKVPVYFSGENARTIDRKSISLIRKGQYEGLKSLLEDENNPERESRQPDLFIDGKLSPTLGATIVSSC